MLPAARGAADVPDGIEGVMLGKDVRTFWPDPQCPCPQDIAQCQFYEPDMLPPHS